LKALPNLCLAASSSGYVPPPQAVFKIQDGGRWTPHLAGRSGARRGGAGPAFGFPKALQLEYNTNHGTEFGPRILTASLVGR